MGITLVNCWEILALLVRLWRMGRSACSSDGEHSVVHSSGSFVLAFRPKDIEYFLLGADCSVNFVAAPCSFSFGTGGDGRTRGKGGAILSDANFVMRFFLITLKSVTFFPLAGSIKAGVQLNEMGLIILSPLFELTLIFPSFCFVLFGWTKYSNFHLICTVWGPFSGAIILHSSVPETLYTPK
jgi:hypothetical protein